MQGKDVSTWERGRQRRVGMQDINRIRDVPGEVESRLMRRTGRKGHNLAGAALRALGRKQSHPVSQLAQSASQPLYYALSATVSTGRKTAMVVECNVHAGAMYRSYFVDAKLATR